MKKIYCVICGKYKKTLVLFIISSKYKNDDEKLLKEDDSIQILKILDLNENIYYFKNMAEENISQEFIYR